MIPRTSGMRVIRRFAASAALATVVVWVPLRAQVAGGTVQGTVTDTSGGVVTKAKVVVKNSDTHVEREVATNEAGFYAAPNLLPGRYQVAASAAGFAQQVVPNLTLTVGGQEVVDIVLRVESQAQQVQVTDTAPPIDTGTSSLSGVVNSKTVVDLPLNGRDWTALATLEPGVSGILTQPANDSTSSTRLNRGLGAQLTIGGNRPEQNNYRVDGVSINDYANAAPGGVLGANLGVDSIQEFSVITSNAPASYGKSSGGIINGITRSGTNRFRGTLYEFLRNSALDARNFFDGSEPPPFKRNQFGASAGGPIRESRTFIFGDYEAVRQNLGTTQQTFVPSPAARAGQLTSGNVNVDSRVRPYLALYHSPNGTVSGDTGIFTFINNQTIKEDFFTTRVDHTLSSKDSIHGTYLFDTGQAMGPDNSDSLIVGTLLRRQLATVEESHIFGPSVLNSVRLGFSRTVADSPKTFGVINPAATDTSLGFLPGAPPGQIQVTGLTDFQGGPGGVGEVRYHYNSFQIYDDASVIRGTHSLGIGFSVERVDSNDLAGSHPLGQFKFGSIANFLTGKPSSFNSSLSPFDTPRGFRQTILGVYFQDDWRLRPNFALNLGLRYEMATVPAEVQHQVSTLLKPTDPAPRVGPPYFQNPTLRNFEPRIGLSWDPSHHGKTAVRAAFGVYDVLPLHYLFEIPLTLSAPFHQEGVRSNLPAGSFPANAFPLTRLRNSYIEQDPHRNYVMQWNVNVQRELLRNLTAFVGYIGSEGVHQPFNAPDMNFVLPTLTPAGYLWPVQQTTGTIVNPNVGALAGILWQGTSSYNALQVKLTQAVSHGLQIQGSYTWAKNLDTSSSSVAGSTFDNSVTELPFFDQRLTRGLSEFDIRHTFAVSYLWQLPAPPSSLGVAGWLIQGWTWGGIVQARTGVPFTPTLGGDPLGLNGSLTFDFPDRLGGPGCKSAVNPGSVHYINTNCFSVPVAPASLAAACRLALDASGKPIPGTCLNLLGNGGRNSLISPGLADLDLSLFKNNPIKKISETFNVQFQAQFFNLLNRTNLAPPLKSQTALFNQSGNPLTSGGVITSTLTSSRQLQFALKLIW